MVRNNLRACCKNKYFTSLVHFFKGYFSLTFEGFSKRFLKKIFVCAMIVNKLPLIEILVIEFNDSYGLNFVNEYT